MEKPSKNFLAVLLADDDPDDCMLFHDAVLELQLNVNLQMVKDGEELMDFLLNSAIVLPEILFLDLNMPLKNGFQCLQEIRRHKILQHIFVVIYSTTANPKDIEEVYVKGANVFIKKPNSFIELKKILQQVLTLDLKERHGPVRKETFFLNA